MNPLYRESFSAMGSRCEIRLAAADASHARRLAALAIAEVRRIEHKYSRYRNDSILSQINRAAGRHAIACDDETSALLDYADAVYRASQGRFDISSGVLRQAWDFRHAQLPQATQLAALLPLVDWRRVVRTPGAVYLPQAGMELDFGGFGKEYAVDRSAEVLLAQGVQHGYVNLGGDMRFLGPQPDGTPWQIGIQHPRDAQATIASIAISRGALTTSGDYERYFELAGQRYCHLLDPRSGMPVTHWRSVSVLAPLALTAGSCSTSAMLAAQQGLDFLEQTGMTYLAMDQHGDIFRRTV